MTTTTDTVAEETTEAPARMSHGLAVFNGHVNDAFERANAEFIAQFGEEKFDKKIDDVKNRQKLLGELKGKLEAAERSLRDEREQNAGREERSRQGRGRTRQQIGGAAAGQKPAAAATAAHSQCTAL